MSTEQLTVKQGAKLTGEASSDRFGYSVAINSTGDTIVVGAYSANSGTGYVKVYKNISGTWTPQGAKITGDAIYDSFGYSVAIDSTGDTIVVGAIGANSATGYAKVYKNISGTWTQQGAKLTGVAIGEYFGRSVAIDSTGDTIVVAAPYANNYTGYVKVYKNISDTWVLQGAKITGEASRDNFGWSVAINNTGDTIVLGAYNAAVGGNSDTGYVKVYKNISDTWVQEGVKLTGKASRDNFGYSVSINSTGDTIVVGAYYAVVGSNNNRGYVKVYKNISGTWTPQGAKITGETTSQLFGYSVAINSTGDTIVVGAPNANSQTGYVKVYKNISGAWTLQGTKLTGEATNNYFGHSVSISASGDAVVVGTFCNNRVTGAAYIFDLQPEGVKKVSENQNTEGLLCSIATEVAMENVSHVETACQALGVSHSDYVNHCIRHYAEHHYQDILDFKKMSVTKQTKEQ